MCKCQSQIDVPPVFHSLVISEDDRFEADVNKNRGVEHCWHCWQCENIKKIFNQKPVLKISITGRYIWHNGTYKYWIPSEGRGSTVWMGLAINVWPLSLAVVGLLASKWWPLKGPAGSNDRALLSSTKCARYIKHSSHKKKTRSV